MEQLHKGEREVLYDIYERTPKEVIEKSFIMDFFSNLPLDDLKRMINYKEINYNTQHLQSLNQRQLDKLKELRNRRTILITAELCLDNGVDDLSLGQIKNQ